MTATDSTSYVFSVPGTELLASLFSIQQDLLFVLDLCNKLDEFREKPFDLVLWEGLCAAAVIRYSRCFSPGARSPISHNLIEAASSDLREFHRRVITIRSKHVAHSVSELEETFVTVTVRRCPNAPPEISGVSSSHGRYAGLELSELGQLRELTKWTLGEVERLSKAERAKVLELAKQAGVDAVVRGGVPKLGRTTYDDAIYKVRSRP